MTAVSIELSQCAKTWPDGTRALHPLDLRVEGGEILALLGPSGCGKTTLLRLVAGLAGADAGSRIRFDGQDVTQLPAERRGVGVVFQNYALFPNMNVLDNVAYGLAVRGLDRQARHARAMQMLELVRLTEHAAKRIDQLSGGQRQRVALARALAIEPRVLLLDEPLTALDAQLREHLRVELAQMLRELGITTLIVTHDQQEAMMLGDRIAVMSAGRLEQVDSPQTLYHSPATPFVAGFIGTLCTVQADLRGETLVPGASQQRFRPHQAVPRPPRAGACRGQVLSRYFLGDSIRLEIALDDGQRLSISAPPDDTHQAGQAVSIDLRRH